MKKRLISLCLALALMCCPVHALEGEAQRAAETLSSLGMVQGTPEGYALDGGATRAQALVLLKRLSGGFEGTAQLYTDVPAWAAPSVAALSAQGLLDGIYAPPTLYSGEFVTADEWSALLLRLFGETVPKEGAALYARRLGLLSMEYDGPLTRGDLFEMTRDALTFSRGGEKTLVQRLVDRGAVTQAAAESLGLLDAALTARETADRHMAAVFRLRMFESQFDQKHNRHMAAASGFFLTADGIAVTNYHALEGASFASVSLVTDEVFPVEGVLWADKEADLAVIRVSRTSLDGLVTTPAFATLQPVSSSDVRPGDVVYALGNPLGLGHSISSGIISAVDRDCALSSIPTLITTADISSGSSGGALLNEYGHVIAVTSGAYIEGNALYLSIPLDGILGVDFSAGEPLPLKRLGSFQTE